MTQTREGVESIRESSFACLKDCPSVIKLRHKSRIIDFTYSFTNTELML